MKKLLSVILAVVTTISFATGCAKLTEIKEMAEESDFTGLVSVGQDIVEEMNIEKPTQDRAGNAITVPDNVEKIVSMAPSTTQVLIELGLGDMMSPDNEAIAALSPDIVFTSGMSSVGGTSPFQSLVDSGICVADIPTPDSIEGVCDDIKFIGTCVGKGAEGLAYAKGLTVFMEGVEEYAKTIPEGEQKTVLVMMNVPSAEYPTIYTFGKGTYMNEMIEDLGAKNVFADQEGWLSVSVEDVIAANPDVILMDCNWMPDAAEQVKALEGWENVNAVKNGEVYQIDEDTCSRPNHHISDATIEWAKCIYPDTYGNFSKSFDDIKNDVLEQVLG